jgi:formate dehydrogenase major subunit
VFLFPAAGHVEKAGTFTNTQRLLQFRDKAVEPPEDARSEAWFIHQLALRLKKLAAASDDPMDAPLRALDWWYPEDSHGEPEIESVLREINGFETAGSDGAHHGEQLAGFSELRDDGSTACGAWIYSGVFGPDGVNRAALRQPTGDYHHGWGYAWPADRRILYNRASARPDGAPWSEKKKLVWWDPEKAEWTGRDVPDFEKKKPPEYRPAPGARGMAALRGDAPFIMHADGLGWLFVPEGLKDGPLPAHYEPLESPSVNFVYARQKNPVARWFRRADNPWASSPDARYPHVLTTYRLTEHHTAGGMSRFLSHLAELQPELFAEISPELAHEVGATNGAFVTIVTPRGMIEARALVTRRIRPLMIDGRVVHQVAMPFHWGPAGLVHGDVVNDLIALSGEPNVTIHESKALLCALYAGPKSVVGPWLGTMARRARNQ